MGQKFLKMIITESCPYLSKDGYFKPHLKRQPKYCFVNNYFGVHFKAW